MQPAARPGTSSADYQRVFAIAACISCAFFSTAFGNAALANCNPLLVMISGAGYSFSEGESMEGLARDLEVPYGADRGIVVLFSQNHKFTSGREIDGDRVQRFASEIMRANYNPIALVGHSWGASTALSLARLLAPSLVVTLDTVALGRSRYLGGTEKWLNVYTPNPGLIYDIAGHEGYSREATQNIQVNLSHTNSEGMYRAVEDQVLSALRCSGEPDSVEDYLECDDIQAYLGTECGLTWKMEDKCSDGQGWEIRFFEFHAERSGEALWVWPERKGHYSIREGVQYGPVDLRNCGIGKLVCYAARSSGGDQRQGLPFDGKGKCEGCCHVCRSTVRDDRFTPLTCSR